MAHPWARCIACTLGYFPDNNVIEVHAADPADPASLERLRRSLFHEFGHVLEWTGLRDGSQGFGAASRSPDVQRIIVDAKADADRDLDEKNALWLGQELNNDYRWRILVPYSELFADVFAVVFLKQTGAPRDFSKLSPDAEPTAKNLHDLMNPTRAYLWQNCLASRINQLEFAIALLPEFNEVLNSELDSEYRRRRGELLRTYSATVPIVNFAYRLPAQALVDRLKKRADDLSACRPE